MSAATSAPSRPAHAVVDAPASAGLLLTGFAFALALAWLVPNHYPPWRAFHEEALASLGGLLLLGATLVSRWPIRWPAIALGAAGLAAVPLVQHLTGQVFFLADALLPALYLAGFALAVCIGATWASAGRGEALLDALFAAALVAAVASTGLAANQWLDVNPLGIFQIDKPPDARPFGNLAQPNLLAVLLEWGLVALLWQFERRRIGAGTLALGAAWLAFGLVMTQSRAGWLAVLLWPAWWMAMRRRVDLRLRFVALLAFVVGFALLVLGWSWLNELLLLAAPSSVEQRLHSNLRVLTWTTLWDAVLSAPWFGYGWNQVILAQQAVALRFPASHWPFEHSHNLLLDLLLWNGVPIGLAFAAGLVAWGRAAVRRCRDATGWIVLAALGSVFVHAAVEYPLDYLFFLIPTGLMMGVVVGDVGKADGQRGRSAWSLAIPGVIVAGFFVAIVVEYVRVEQGVREARFAVANLSRTPLSALQDLDVTLLDSQREFHRFVRTSPRPGMTVQELDRMRTVAMRFPYPPTLFSYATAAGLNGRESEAADTLRRICKMSFVQRCREAVEGWQALQRDLPPLRRVPPPEADGDAPRGRPTDIPAR